MWAVTLESTLLNICWREGQSVPSRHKQRHSVHRELLSPLGGPDGKEGGNKVGGSRDCNGVEKAELPP